MNKNIVIALSKGRIYQDTLPLLKAIGIEPLDDPQTSRKLKLATNLPNVSLLVIRATDVPTFVQYGVADCGVSGKDVLLEQDLDNIYELIDLKIAQCKMMTAGIIGDKLPSGKIKVATKYPNTAKKFFNKKGKQTEIIKLYGAMELAPIIGLTDCIVDLVETGNTLKANGLEPWELISNISSQFIVNKTAVRTKGSILKDLIDKISVIV